MNSTSQAEENNKRTNRWSGFDVESLLATSVSNTSPSNTSPKLTATVQPFEINENDPMESSIPRQNNSFQKAPSNQPMLPNLGFAVPSPLALANLQLYSLWSQGVMPGMVNWPLIANPVFTQSIHPMNMPFQHRTSERNTTNTKYNEENPNDDSSLNSNPNSATESLFAASECHLAVLRDDDGDTPLHIAIVHENQRLIQKLVGLISFSRLTVNTPNNLSQTPLHLAVLTKQPLVVQLLMKAGGDPNFQDRNGQTPVHIAAFKGYLTCLAEILVHSTSNSTDLRIKNFEGFTALHVAVQKQHKSIVEALLQYGANINAKDGKSGHTPLHHAVDCESCEVLQLLVTKGANVNKVNYSGITPVQSANSCRNEAVSKILLSGQEAAVASPGKFKTTTTFASTAPTVTEPSTTKNAENRTEVKKRSREPSPSTSTSKRPRPEIIMKDGDNV